MKKSKIKKAVASFLGLIAGFIGGFFGGGGGMASVPILQHLLKLDAKKAHASTMLVILPMSIFAWLTYFFKGSFEPKPTLMCAIGVMIGGIIGAILLKKLNSSVVSISFAVIMIFGGIKMIF